MKKAFYIVWVLLVFLCIFVLIGGTFKDFARKFIVREKRNGYTAVGFYEFTLVEDTWANIQVHEDAPNPPLESVDVIAFGDSFFDAKLDSPVFAVKLAQKLKRPVYNHAAFTFENPRLDFNPVDFLKSVHYRKGKRKYLILETVERLALIKRQYYRSGRPSSPKTNLLVRIHDGLSWRLWEADRWVKRRVILLNNGNEDYRYFLANNFLLYPVSRWIANVKFRWLGDIHPLVDRRYDRRSKMFFFKEEVAFNRKEKSPETLAKLADDVAEVAGKLREDYNIELIYLIMPNKYSLYSDLVEPSYFYDGFIPKVNEMLKKKGIRSIDIYSAYMDYRHKGGKGWLYYPSNSHFAPLGMDILVDLTARGLQNEFGEKPESIHRKQ